MPSSNITYAVVRIDTDEDVSEIASKIQNLEKEISCLTVIDVFGFKTVPREVDENGNDVTSPVLYWP